MSEHDPLQIDLSGAMPGASGAKHGAAHRLRNTLMAGLTVIAPLWITGWVLWTLFNWADRFSRPLIRPFAALLGDPDWYYRGIGFLLTFLILWVVGRITTNVVTRRLLHDAREALERLPIVRTIYSPVRRLTETMTSPDKAGFKQVVLVEYPRKGAWSVGFVAGDVPFEDGRPPGVSIFVPTAPNPTTGFLLIVARQEVVHTGLSIEAAFQMIISAGVAVPPALRLPAAADEAIGRDAIVRLGGGPAG